MDDDFFVYLLMFLVVVGLAVLLIVGALKAFALSWWIQLGGAGVMLAAPFAYDRYIADALRTLQLQDFVEARYAHGRVGVVLSKTFAKKHKAEATIFSGIVLIGLLIGGIALLVHRVSHHPFWLLWLAIPIYACLVIGMYYIFSHQRLDSRVAAFEREALDRIKRLSVNIDITRIENAVDALERTAKAAHIKLLYRYPDKLRELLTAHLPEMVAHGKLSPAAAQEFDDLAVAAEDDCKELQAALQAIDDLNAYYRQVFTDVRASRDRGLNKELAGHYSPARGKLLLPYVAGMRWKELRELIEMITDGLAIIHGKL